MKEHIQELVHIKRFADFEVWIGSSCTSGTPGVFPVQIFSSPAGPATGNLALDISAADFQAELVEVQSADPNLEVRKSFGKRLFEALFAGKVRDAWMASRGRVNAGEAGGLRLRLWINVPELAVLPWELLWEDEQNNTFLATSANLAVSRYLPVPEPPVLLAREPLRIVVSVERPQGVPDIDQKEVEHLKASLQALGDAVVFEVLYNPTMTKIEDALEQDYHVLHFLGHGVAGKLMVTGNNGRAMSIDDEAFAQLVQGRRNLRLVVLHACHSSQADQAGLFSGVGPALIQKGLPAVIAMQYPFVQLDTASCFSQAFYAALANGQPVDVAVNAARRALSAGPLLDSRDWSTPVLYMGTRSGDILGFLNRETDAVKRALQEVQVAKPAVPALQRIINEVTYRSYRIREWESLEDHLHNVEDSFKAFWMLLQDVKSSGDLAKQAPELRKHWTPCQNVYIPDLNGFARHLEYIHQPPEPGTVGYPDLQDGIRSLVTIGFLIENALTGGLFDELQKRAGAFNDALRRQPDYRNIKQQEMNLLCQLAHDLRDQLKE